MVESWIVNVVDAHDCVERAAIVHMPKLDALDVVYRRTGVRGDVKHIAQRDVDELRIRIEEAADKPWTGDAIDFRMLPRNPFVRRLAIFTRGQLRSHPAP